MGRKINVVWTLATLIGWMAAGCAAASSGGSTTKTTWLDALDVGKVNALSTGGQRRGAQPVDSSTAIARVNKSIDGNDLMVNGTKYERGICVNAPSEFAVDLHGQATRFTAIVGVDDGSRAA